MVGASKGSNAHARALSCALVRAVGMSSPGAFDPLGVDDWDGCRVRGFALLTRGYRVVRPLRGRWAWRVFDHFAAAGLGGCSTASRPLGLVCVRPLRGRWAWRVFDCFAAVELGGCSTALRPLGLAGAWRVRVLYARRDATHRVSTLGLWRSDPAVVRSRRPGRGRPCVPLRKSRI